MRCYSWTFLVYGYEILPCSCTYIDTHWEWADHLLSNPRVVTCHVRIRDTIRGIYIGGIIRGCVIKASVMILPCFAGATLTSRRV
ncbi:hypothetical protein M6B38_387825 [Iris pallida]|uniref:Uncharacterized protein n=1 Tax=Iris pallida TaxID=29817 RepID=A0AAX6G2K7_IRIPA|nr:hypothetical protein M6B38_387825 [Iris pallida]